MLTKTLEQTPDGRIIVKKNMFYRKRPTKERLETDQHAFGVATHQTIKEWIGE